MSVISKLKSLASHQGAIMVSRLAGAGVGFLTQFLLVKLMGAHELGIFYAASSLAAVLGVIAAQGYPQIAARFVGRYRNKNDAGLSRSFTGHAVREGLIVAALMAIAVTAWALLWPGFGPGEHASYTIAGWMILAIVVLNILTNVAGGMRRFGLCYMPEGLVRPILFFVTICVAGIAGLGLSAQWAMGIFAAITAGLALAVAAALRSSLPGVKLIRPARGPMAWRWRSEAWQLVLLAIFTNFFADVGILVAAPFLTSAELAVFGLCLKLALLVGYFVQIGQQMVVPDMSDARHAGDEARIRRAAWRSIGVPTIITLFGMAIISWAGGPLLSLFGPEFAAGRTTLLILLSAQLLRALAGPSAHLLTLSGIQSVNLGLAVTSLIVLLMGSAVLSPAYGIEGAALAVLLAYGYWITCSALALRWLKEPSVDALWLTLTAWRAPSTPR